MTKQVWKFPLKTTDEQVIEMPRGSVILCVAVQADIPCLWALVQPSESKVQRLINVVGTGHPCREAAENYIGTYQLEGGSLVFHVFAEPE